MAQHKVDSEDALVFALFGLAAAATVGIADVTILGYSFSDTLFNLAGTAITIASTVSIAAFGWVVYTNQVGMEDIQKLDQEYYIAVIVTAVLIVGIPFVPSLHDFVTSSDYVALGAIAVESAGLVAVSYMA